MSNRTGKLKEGSTKQLVAELMSQDIDIDAIAERLRISRKAVQARMSDIRRDLGWLG